MTKQKQLMLILLPDGDIEIREAHQLVQDKYLAGKCVRHRSYNMGDRLTDNLIEEFDAMFRMSYEIGDVVDYIYDKTGKGWPLVKVSEDVYQLGDTLIGVDVHKWLNENMTDEQKRRWGGHK